MNPISEEERTKRRYYGRGLFDGLRMAGVEDPENFMNQAKLDAAERSLNSMARKVLGAIPTEESYTPAQIVASLARAGSNVSTSVVDGCLNTLKDNGLVREPEHRKFVRVVPRVRIVHHQAPAAGQAPTVAAAPAAPAAEPSPAAPPAPEGDDAWLDAMASGAAQARELAARMLALAKTFEDLAIVAEQRIRQSSSDAESLRKLRELLKGV